MSNKWAVSIAYRLFPPGILKKLGLRPFSAVMRSFRMPFALFLYVGGNRLIMLKFNAPAEASNSIDSVLLTFGAEVLGSIVYLCSTHFPAVEDDGISRLAYTLLVMDDCSLTVKRPLYAPKTQKVPVYL